MEESNSELYMYVLVNDDLKMGKGKIASQVGHVVGMITEEIIRKSYESNKGIPDCYLRYVSWKNNGSGKIILKASEEQIKRFIGHPETAYVVDAGRTQVVPDSLTALGFYPSAFIREKLSGFKLL